MTWQRTVERYHETSEERKEDDMKQMSLDKQTRDNVITVLDKVYVLT